MKKRALKVTVASVAMTVGLAIPASSAFANTGYEGHPGNQSSNNGAGGNGLSGYEGHPGNQGG